MNYDEAYNALTKATETEKILFIVSGCWGTSHTASNIQPASFSKCFSGFKEKSGF